MVPFLPSGAGLAVCLRLVASLQQHECESCSSAVCSAYKLYPFGSYSGSLWSEPSVYRQGKQDAIYS